MNKILFISHDASRTGAPLTLLRLIEQIKIYSDLEVHILLKNDGELKNEFEKLGETYVWNFSFKEKGYLNKLKNRIANKTGLHKLTRAGKHKASVLKKIKEVDFIFNNTITNASLLRELPLNGKRVFSYFHEMQVITEFFSSSEDVAYLNNISEKIFVASSAVKNFLIYDYDIPEQKIAFLKYIIPKREDEIINKLAEGINKNRIGTNKFVVGFCATLDWRKGYDFLPLIAKKIIIDKNIHDIHFVWIGVNKNSMSYSILKNDLRKLNLESYFTLMEPIQDIQPYLAQFNIIALPSREDAFPLVVLEAAYYEVPCVYFSNAGGISEFSGNDAGIAIDYLDIDGMAEKIIELKINDKFRKALGKRAKGKIIEYSDHAKILEGLLDFLK